MDIKRFLQSSYDYNNFKEFIFDKFYGFEENDTNYEEPTSETEQKHIQKYKFLGQVELDDKKEIGFFEVFTTEKTDIENNRVTLGNILKNKASNELLDGAISVFVNPKNPSIWRLSFIAFSYDENDKQGVNSLKRYTYVLGKDIPIKTALNQLEELKYPKFTDLINAFSIEKITEEFYKGIILLYNNLINKYLIYPSKNEKNKIEFSVRLIGRLIFIKFLNKKNLILNDIFEVTNNYYKSILEPLFFEQLNTEHFHRKQIFKNENIPFLNGGLFEPLMIDYYDDNILEIKDTFFKEFFEHLNKYNFSVDENSVEDSDLSIDPEMLGRVFENLLAEINVNTNESARKASGTYYTPREVVDFMINESLIEYLNNHTSLRGIQVINLIKHYIVIENDYEKTEVLTALFKLKSIDPACGSGAFPIGLLQKIVKILELIDPDANIWFNLQNKEFKEKHKNRNKNYIRKLSIIKNSIYGIDNHSIAIEITKLRAFLSLIVDEKVIDTNINRGIEPLPNLEFKFICADSLLSLDHDIDNILYKQMNIIKDKYFHATCSEKNNIKNEYIDILGNIHIDDSIKNYNPFEPTSIAKKVDTRLMFDFQDKFHLVIGNPPYMRIQNIDKELSEIYKEIYESATGSFDIYVIFVERALELINENGIINFIMPDRWINSAFGKGLRKTVYSKIYKLISFKDYQVFNASTYTSLIFLKNDASKINYIQLSKDLKNNLELKIFLDSINNESYAEIDYSSLSEEGWILVDKKSNDILNKLKMHKKSVKDIFERIYTGLQTSLDNVYFLHDCKSISEKLISGYSHEIKKEIAIEKAILKPLLKGDDVIKYKDLITSIYVIFPYIIEIEKNKEKAVLIPENEISSHYPLAYEYLKNCEDVLRARERGKFNISGEWYQYGRKQGMTGIEEPKIVARDISKGGDFSYDKNGEFYHTTTVYGYKKYPDIKEDYKFYLAILNSKLMWWYLQKVGTPLANGYYRYMPRYVENFPIPIVNDFESKLVENLIDYIIYINSSIDKINDYISNEYLVKEFYEIIDAIIYELYFKKSFQDKKISFIEQDELNLKNFRKITDNEKKNEINNLYKKLNESESKIRTNLSLIDIELKSLIVPIKRAYYV